MSSSAGGIHRAGALTSMNFVTEHDGAGRCLPLLYMKYPGHQSSSRSDVAHTKCISGGALCHLPALLAAD